MRFPEVLSPNVTLILHPSTQILSPTGVSAEMEITVPGCSATAK
jgi:hypothetical protein